MKGMKKFIAFGAALASLWSGASSLVEAQQCCEPCCPQECCESPFRPWNSLSISGGWRYDRLRTRSGSRASDADIAATPHQTLRLKNLNIWQIGGQLHWSVPNFCECEYTWLNRFYVRGYAYRGWVTSGKLHHRTDGVLGFSDHNGSKIHKGRTVDGTIGVGFLYPFCSGIAIGPVGGWSYEQLHVSTKHHNHSSSSSSSFGPISSSSSESFFLDEHRSFTSTFRGPWVGFDVAYEYTDCCRDLNLRFEAGYEFHWARWHGSNKFRNFDSLTEGSRHHRQRSRDAWGNYGYVNAWWVLCENWELGLGVKYQSWEARRHHRRSSSSSSSDFEDSSNGPRRIRRVCWDSVQVNLDLGYSF